MQTNSLQSHREKNAVRDWVNYQRRGETGRQRGISPKGSAWRVWHACMHELMNDPVAEVREGLGLKY